MNKYNVEVDFTVGSNVWLVPKTSSGGLRLKKAKISEITIKSDDIYYKYESDTLSGVFTSKEVGEFAFQSAEDANGFYSEKYNKLMENYGEFTVIFFMIRKKISDFKNCKSFNAGTKHCIATNLTYELLDKTDRIEPLHRDATIIHLIDEIDEAQVNFVIETNNLEDDKGNFINEKTAYEKVFSCLNTVGDFFSICVETFNEDASLSKTLAKIYKNGIIMYFENSQNDPIVNELIEEIIKNHL